jgi:hypothetical protein
MNGSQAKLGFSVSVDTRSCREIGTTKLKLSKDHTSDLHIL